MSFVLDQRYQKLWAVRLSAALLLLIGSLQTAPAQSGGMMGGGSMMSRGGDRAGQRGGTPSAFSFYAALLGNYSSGAVTPIVDADGRLTSTNIYGGSIELGVTGSKSFGRSVLGIDWRGDYRRVSRSSYTGNQNGTDQALSLFYSSQPSRRWIYQASVAGMTTNRAIGGFVAPSFLRQDLTGLPLNDVLDSRVYALQTSGAVSYLRTARQRVSFFGTAYAARRSSAALIGTNGLGGGAQYSYALSSRTTVGAVYNFFHFNFPKVFGASDIHSVALTFERRINRDWTLIGNFGGFRAETLGATSVPLDPAVAEILGVSMGVQAIYRVNYGPWYSADLAYRLSERASCTLGVNQTVTPGNGLYLTSRSASQSIGCSVQLPRRASLSVSAGRSEYNSLYQEDLGKFESYQGGGGINYLLKDHVNFTSQFDVRSFNIVRGGSKVGWTASVGLAYTPNSRPIPRW